MATAMEAFDLCGPLPAAATTTVLEASAGTGKTFALAGLVTRYVAEGHATLDQMLLITFGRAASRELRERVREQLDEAALALDAALDGPATLPGTTQPHELLVHLTTGTSDELAERRRHLRDALANFDAATIATTHQFCQLVLTSLGVAGDTDAGVTLVDSLDELVGEIVDDLYLRRFGHDRESPDLTHGEALRMARAVVANPHTELRPSDPAPGTPAAVRVEFARAVLAELEHRKRRLGVLGYDDLLTRLATALEPGDAPARARMRDRWSIVMVDEFQDTDPVQWQVVERAFSGHATLVLIGDPKQAIYAFRGGDVVTYLGAARTAGERRTLPINWRSDQPLVEGLQAVLRGAELGHSEIVVHDVEARHAGHRLAGAPHNDPFRLRVLTREDAGVRGRATIGMDKARELVATDMAADVKRLLASDATWGGEGVRAEQVAVIVESHRDARACRDALAAAGVPAVYTGDTDVFASRAAQEWLCLLEAFEQPHRSGLVRAAAATMFFGETAESLAAGGDAVTDRVADTLREWADHARERGVAAVFEAAQVAGMGQRVLSWAGGERHMTDLAHLAQVLHETAHTERFGLPALLDWMRAQCEEGSGSGERNRRLDSDAAAVQIMTVWVSKGLQYPIVYLPFAFNRYVPAQDLVLFHDGEQRCLHIGGKGDDDFGRAGRLGRAEAAGDDIRLTYVAMTRAQSQVVTWWAPTWDEPNGGLSRLLRGRAPGETRVPDRCEPKPRDAEALAALRRWEALGGPVIERAVPVGTDENLPDGLPADLGVRVFDREIDTAWRRTSYSALVRDAVEALGVGSEPEAGQEELGDEVAEIPELPAPPAVDAPVPPLDPFPGGATFGSLVHGILETADPDAADLATELAERAREQLAWWPADLAGLDASDLGEALVPLHHTPLGPFADERTLGQVPLVDRLSELDFEMPLAGGDLGPSGEVTVAGIADLLTEHLPAGDPFLSYVDRLRSRGLGPQVLRGYLAGSVDVVLRIPDDDHHRFLVVDYKTNRLGHHDAPNTAADYAPERLAEAMLHSDYPLQALLYVVVLHRYLRWRLPGYDPGAHLGGVLYLYLRGMCGPETPVGEDGHRAGVFGWRPPASLVVALSDLLDGADARSGDVDAGRAT